MLESFDIITHVGYPLLFLLAVVPMSLELWGIATDIATDIREALELRRIRREQSR